MIDRRNLLLLAAGTGAAAVFPTRVRAEIVSAEKFGVRADGESNSTKALQRALDAGSSNGLEISLPAGRLIVDELELPRYAQMRGHTRKTVVVHRDGTLDAMFTLPKGPIIDVQIANASFVGNGLEGEHGFHMNAQPSDSGNGGLWCSQFENIRGRGFGGKFLWIRGGAAMPKGTDYPNQFLTLRNVQISRPSSASSRCLSITGKVGQFYTEGYCDFQGPNPLSKLSQIGTNIVISREFSNGDAADGGHPISDDSPFLINLKLSSQNSHCGILIDRAGMVSIRESYFENLLDAIRVQSNCVINLQSSMFASVMNGVIGNNSVVYHGENVWRGAVFQPYSGNGINFREISTDVGWPR